jgi:pyrimidine operon attenuation protein/uracil phosphoribosyltransferase
MAGQTPDLAKTRRSPHPNLPLTAKPMPAIDLPDAEAQCAELAELIRPRLQPDTVLVGIHSGGVWVARRLRELLGLRNEIGLIDVSFYRDDYGEKGSACPRQAKLDSL